MRDIGSKVFISYRRETSWELARAVFENLWNHGFDVFMDLASLGPGDFEHVTLAHIRARPHFVVLLHPSALDRCDRPGDWLRREIELAIDMKHNIVPLMYVGFDYSTPAVSSKLTGKLATLKKYNSLHVHQDVFEEVMEKLGRRFLSVPPDIVIHPLPSGMEHSAKKRQEELRAADPVSADELSAEYWFEKGYVADNAVEQIEYYTRAIELSPGFAEAYNNRGTVRRKQHDLDGALADFTMAVELRPDFADAYNNRGITYKVQDNLDAAIDDYTTAIMLKQDDPEFFFNRGNSHRLQGNYSQAIYDFTTAISLKRDDPQFYFGRGIAHVSEGSHANAIDDFTAAIRYAPGFVDAYYNRGLAHEREGELGFAIIDYEHYCEMGGTRSDEVWRHIRDVRGQLLYL